MNKRVKTIVLAVITTLTIQTSVFASSTGTINIDTQQNLLNIALSNRTFYNYNMAFFSILDVKDENVKNQLLSKLATISNEIYTPEILHYLDLLAQVAQNGSGKVYDQTEAELRNSKLNDFDKGYLLGELTSWGKQKVYSADYISAVDEVILAWNNKDLISQAEDLINKVSNTYSKDYLLEQLALIKDKFNTQPTGQPNPTKVSGIDWDLTNKLSKPFVDYYTSSIEVTNLDLLIKSAVNISEGKDVDEGIKTSWAILPTKYGTQYPRASYSSHIDVVAVMDNPTEQAQYNKEPSSYNVFVFNYRIVYWNADLNKYQVHFIAIGI
jgi:hypothetical protein